jgi:hypothetical protein
MIGAGILDGGDFSFWDGCDRRVAYGAFDGDTAVEGICLVRWRSIRYNWFSGLSSGSESCDD